MRDFLLFLGCATAVVMITLVTGQLLRLYLVFPRASSPNRKGSEW